VGKRTRVGGYPLGVGRPPLGIDDLPTPEAVFDVPKTGVKETVTKIMGPALIALGLSIGSGEWLLGPQAIGELGWVGVGFVIMVSIVLQAFYNVEIGRYVMATGEVPSLASAASPRASMSARSSPSGSSTSRSSRAAGRRRPERAPLPWSLETSRPMRT
jgi:hypothetical protein